jgi:predicted MFS family arabinose efflux permease
MWELYTLWTFVPLVLISYSSQAEAAINPSYWSFIIIAAGSIGCVVGGIYSRKFGSERIAWFQLTISGLCCLMFPFLFIAPTVPFLMFMMFWGMVVVGDSPQFSAVVARSAPKNLVGTGLTIVNSIGFAITIPSIQLVSYLSEHFSARYILLVLAAGPLFGILSMRKLIRQRNDII